MNLLRRMIIGCLLLTSGWVMGEEAESTRLSSDTFARLAIHRNGRAMPMDSVARHFLMEFSGRGTVKVPSETGKDGVEKLDAIDWFARVLFDPETTDDDPIFLVEHPEAAEALDLPRHKRDRFTYNELKDAIPALREKVAAARSVAPDDRGLVEQELLRVDANLQQYLALRISFMFAVPRNEFAVRTPVLRNMLQLKEDESKVSFWQVMGAGAPMAQLIESIQNKPQSEWTPAQAEALMLSSTLFDWSKQLRGLPLLMVPLDSPGEDVWVSPWDAIAQQAGVPRVREKIGLLADMTMAWRGGNQAAFDAACKTYRTNAEGAVMTESAWRNIDRELSYNRRNWFTQARMFYILTVLTGLILVSFPSRAMWVAVVACFALGFLCHSTGIVQRMIIMNRPPITNLYATFLFVGWVIAIAGIVLEWITRKGFGLLMGSFCAAVLLFVSIRWAIEGDTMRPLVPVLNSNFWLWTHVITINMGYSGAFFAGVAGHAWLIMAALRGKRHPIAKLSAQLMYGMIAFGLTFSFIGTMLGGIWADQSWGRFWGWDPKENGALLIVLWLGAILHAQMGGLIRERGMATAAVLGVIVLLFAWLGTNLLGVGLHSYGFTSGVKRALYWGMSFEAIFAVVMCFLVGLGPLIKPAEKRVVE